MFFIEKKKKLAVFTIVIMFFSLIAGFTGAFMYLNSLGDTHVAIEKEKPDIKGQSLNKGIDSIQNLWKNDKELSIPEIYTLVSDSVVEITTEGMKVGGIMGQYISEGAGSGVIYSKDGYIITNNHVINNASKIKVRLKNGEKYEAEIIGKDIKTDIAVIKIKENGLPTALFADSNEVIVGELAVAIGNPLGELGGTITEGIISASDREIIIDNETMVLLQTTAAINPGNSGGGLFNSKGELLGIVNAKTSGSNIEGLGFAIPANIVSKVVKELMDYGYVKGRPALGVSIFEVLDDRTAYMNQLDKVGLYIVDAKEGRDFKVGDRIISFDGKEVLKLSELKKLIDSAKIGDRVLVKVERDNAIEELKITLIELS